MDKRLLTSILISLTFGLIAGTITALLSSNIYAVCGIAGLTTIMPFSTVWCLITWIANEQSASRQLPSMEKQIGEYSQVLNSAAQEVDQLNEELERLSKVAYIVPFKCEYCKRDNEVLFDLAQQDFKCEHCGETNAVYTNITIARITDPVSERQSFKAASEQN